MNRRMMGEHIKGYVAENYEKCSSDFKISNRNEICNGLIVRESFGNKIQSNCIYIIL